MKISLIVPALILVLIMLMSGCASQAAPVTVTSTTTNLSTVTTTGPAQTITSTAPAVTVTTTVTVSQPAVTVTVTPQPAPTYDVSLNGQWTSNEKNSGLATGPFLKFQVNNGQITSLTITVFPLPSEYFLWFPEKPLDIKNGKFSCTVPSMPANKGKADFTLEGKFNSDGTCSGTMKFPAGFYWVDFAMPNDVVINWTAHK